MKKINTIKLFIIASLLCFFTSCTNQRDAINIAVASNFEKTLKEIVALYKIKHPHSKINIISGASGVLTNQILNHAPFDLFLSADTVKPSILLTKNPTLNNPNIYAIGQLALWVPDSQEKNQCISSLDENNSLVIANPKTAPYGAVSHKILNRHNIKTKKTIFAANIAQSFLYTQNKFADAGFVAYSMLMGNKKGCQQIFQHRELSQSMILLNNNAKEIYNFILSKESQNLIEESGYNTINPKENNVTKIINDFN